MSRDLCEDDKPRSFFSDYYASDLEIDDRADLFSRCLERYKKYHAEWQPSEASRVALLLRSELPPWPRGSIFHDCSIDEFRVGLSSSSEAIVILSLKGKAGSGALREITYEAVENIGFRKSTHGMLIAMSEICGRGTLVSQTLHLVGGGRINLEFQAVSDVSYW